MLAGLSIRNVVLIENLSLAFARGLSALTGETGAGKSILLDALGLATGGRADGGLVRHGADQASVIAAFELADDHPAFDILASQDLAAEQPLVLRRTLGRDGRSRAFVNDQPVSVGLLRRLGEALIEVHGQFDTHGLIDQETHRGLLDAFGRHDADLAATAGAWRSWAALEEERRAAADTVAHARAEEDWLRHALAELDALEPEEGEEDGLAARRTLLMHRERLVEALAGARADLAGERGAERSLGSALRSLQRVADKAGGLVDAAIDGLDRALAEAAEASAEIARVIADADCDPAGLERLEERLFALRAAARKHGVAVDALSRLRAEMAARLDLIEDGGNKLERLATEAAAARQAFVETAASLCTARRAAAKALDRAVAAELAPLRLDKARFSTLVEPLPEASWGPGGAERVAFLAATNPGTPPAPIARIASGGELARFMLALKVVLAEVGSAGTLIFDEVDSGIGGATAAAVGERLARLGAAVQVLVVTHSPQVAARADHHLRVQKSAPRGQATVTTVTGLEPDERREEIARMLSGATVTEQARAAAESLMAARVGHG